MRRPIKFWYVNVRRWRIRNKTPNSPVSWSECNNCGRRIGTKSVGTKSRKRRTFRMKMFRNRKYHLLDFAEFQRRMRRQFEGNLNYRKIILILFLCAIIFLYIGPYIFSWLFSSSTKSIRKLKFQLSKSCQKQTRRRKKKEKKTTNMRAIIPCVYSTQRDWHIACTSVKNRMKWSGV